MQVPLNKVWTVRGSTSAQAIQAQKKFRTTKERHKKLYKNRGKGQFRIHSLFHDIWNRLANKILTSQLVCQIEFLSQITFIKQSRTACRKFSFMQQYSCPSRKLLTRGVMPREIRRRMNANNSNKNNTPAAQPDREIAATRPNAPSRNPRETTPRTRRKARRSELEMRWERQRGAIGDSRSRRDRLGRCCWSGSRPSSRSPPPNRLEIALARPRLRVASTGGCMLLIGGALLRESFGFLARVWTFGWGPATLTDGAAFFRANENLPIF
jgi:hypothetical protein